MGMGRIELLIVAALALSAVTLGWFARSGIWRRRRLAIIAGAVLAAFLILSRRVGWGELLVVAAVVVLPAVILPSRGPGPRR